MEQATFDLLGEPTEPTEPVEFGSTIEVTTTQGPPDESQLSCKDAAEKSARTDESATKATSQSKPYEMAAGDAQAEAEAEPEPAPTPESNQVPEDLPSTTDAPLSPSDVKTSHTYSIVMGRMVPGDYEQLSVAEVFRCMNGEISLDLDSRYLDDPRILHSSIIACRRRDKFQILNRSATTDEFNRVPLHRDDRISVFTVHRAEDVKALTLSLEPYYLAQWGREPEDAQAFLRLCFVDQACEDATAVENAKIFRQWAGPSSKPFSLDDVIDRFGFHSKRRSKFKALKLDSGLTHKRDSAEPKATDICLETQQKKLTRFLNNTHFNPASSLWNLGVSALNKLTNGPNTLPTDWRIVVAAVAAHQRTPRDPSTRFTHQASVDREVHVLVSGFSKWMMSELEIDISNEAVQAKAQILLASVEENDNEDK